MQTIIIHGESQRLNVLGLIKGLNLAKPWEVALKPHVKKRSNPQNALYWKWLGVISKATGNDSDDLHEFFAGKFLPKVEREVLGEKVLKPISTTKLNKQEFTQYLNQVNAFAGAELGLILPHPDDRNYAHE